jgi:cobalt-zinc-cadmium efflux system membrane fusion protein
MKHASRSLAALLWIPLWFACTADTLEDGHSADRDHEEHGRAERVSLSEEAYLVSGVTVARVETRTLRPAVRVTGTLSYDERKMAIGTARIGGRIMEVVADYGQHVAEGAPLAWIDSPELGAAQADYLRAVSIAGLRAAEYERAVLLLEGRAISRGELLRREAELRAAEADLQTAEQKLHILGLSQADIERLSDGPGTSHVYPVRAPIAGRVTERRAVAGRVVAPEDELFTVASLDSLWLFLQVFEKDLPSIAEGADVTLRCESHPTERFRGTIDFVGQVLDPHSRTIRARAVIDNPDGELKPGMFVYATIEGRPSGGEGLRPAVPVTAIANIDGAAFVFVEIGERSFEPRPVVTGVASGEWVEIRSGLDVGEPIAVSGVFTLKSENRKSGLRGHEH